MAGRVNFTGLHFLAQLMGIRAVRAFYAQLQVKRVLLKIVINSGAKLVIKR